MASSPERNKESTPTAPGPQAGAPADRRHFLRMTLTVGLVMVTAGIASVAKSLLSPTSAPPPTPAAATGSTKTVTKTVTTTVGGGGSGTSTASTGSASTTQSSVTETTSTSSSPFPQIRVGNISDLASGEPISFNYPLEETPNLLFKLGVKAQGGVGPDGDIVAFSQVCQHLGCLYGYVPAGKSPECDNTYKATSPVGYCCCHASVFDLSNLGKVLDGPSPRPVPQVTLKFDSSSGDIFAIGMGPPAIFGHGTGSNHVLDDLKGGTLVSQ